MIHVSNIGEIIDIQCKKDVKKVEFSSFLFGGGRKTKPHFQPLSEERGVVSCGNGRCYFGVN